MKTDKKLTHILIFGVGSRKPIKMWKKWWFVFDIQMCRNLNLCVREGLFLGMLEDARSCLKKLNILDLGLGYAARCPFKWEWTVSNL